MQSTRPSHFHGWSLVRRWRWMQSSSVIQPEYQTPYWSYLVVLLQKEAWYIVLSCLSCLCFSCNIVFVLLCCMACLLTYILQAGHLKMLDGYIDFFMDPSLSECYLQLREELDKLIQKKVSHTLGKFGRFSSDISPWVENLTMRAKI